MSVMDGMITAGSQELDALALERSGGLFSIDSEQAMIRHCK